MSTPAFKLPVLPRRLSSDPRLASKARFMALGADCANCPLKYHKAVSTQWLGGNVPPALALVGEAPGRREVMTGIPFCLVPETLVLMADLTWKQLADVRIGDKILTVEEEAPKGNGVSETAARRWVVAEVSQKIQRKAPVLTVKTADGSLTGTADHRVLTKLRNYSRKQWLRLDQLLSTKTRRSHLVFFAAPWKRAATYTAGWLAGFFDGEGHVLGSKQTGNKRSRNGQVGFSQNAGPTYDRAIRYLRETGFAVGAREEARKNNVTCKRARVRGGFAETARFLGIVRPERLIEDFARVIDGKRSSRGLKGSRVDAISPGGTRGVIDITTTAGTFIANGFVVHNCGPSGNVLNYACTQGGVDRRQMAVTNVIACGPIPSDAEAVKKAAMNACRPRLITELRALRPAVVMAMGGVSLRSLAPEGSSGVTALRGAKLDVAEDIPTLGWHPRALFSTFHPAHVMRGGDGEADTDNKSVDALYYFILFDLAKAWRFAHGETVEWAVDADLFADVDGQLRRIEFDGKLPHVAGAASGQELYDALGRVYEEARAHGEITCDVETDSKDSLDANLTAIAYATPDGGVSATWTAWRMFSSVERLLYAIHSDRNLPWLWQNGIYDRVVLKRHKVLVDDQHKSLEVKGLKQGDTLLAHHASFPGLPHRLDSIATQFHVVAPWKNEFRQSTKDNAELIFYNVNDAVMTARLGPAIYKHVKLAKTERVYEADRQLNVVATDMRQYGCYVDRGEQARHRATQTSRLEYMKNRLEADLAKIEEPWRQALARLMADKQRKNDPASYLERVSIRYTEIAERDRKPTDIGLFKTKAKLDIVALFNVLKIPVLAYTKTGLPVTDKKAMEAAAARHPLMRSLIHIREAQHMIANFVDIRVRDNGRFHIDWKTNKITGRWGGQFMNVPNNVSSWPPLKDDAGNFQINKHGDYVCRRDNLRSIIAAPTATQVLEIAARGRQHVHPLVLGRAKQGFGRKLIGADEDQVELRIVGFLSREPFLLDIFNGGRDPHSEFARNVIYPKEFPALEKTIADAGYKPKQTDAVEAAIKTLADRNDDIANVQRHKLDDVLNAMAGWKRLRDLAKRIEYGSLYRGEAPTLWESVVKDFPMLELSDVEKMLNKVHEAMPRVVAWWNECDTYARRFREIRETWLNRVRFFPLGNFEPSIAVNFPVQARNAGLMATATFRFIALTRPELLDFEGLYRHRLLDAAWVNARRDEGYARWRSPVNLILQVHDSLTAEADEEDAARVGKLLTLCMHQIDVNERYGIKMEYTGESKISQRWSKT